MSDWKARNQGWTVGIAAALFWLAVLGACLFALSECVAPDDNLTGNAIPAPLANHQIISPALHHQSAVDNPNACITEAQAVLLYQHAGYRVFKLYAVHLGYLADKFLDAHLRGDGGVVAVHDSISMVQVSIFTGGCEEYRALLPKDETEQVLLMLEA